MKFDELYKKIISENIIDNENIKYHNITLAIIPGSFKPPHKGHWEMIEEYAKNSDKVLILISNISKNANKLRNLSKSTLLQLGKILNKYNVNNKETLELIKIIQSDVNTLTFDKLNAYINKIYNNLSDNSKMKIELEKFMNNLEKTLYKSIRYDANGNEITPEVSKEIFEIFINAYNLQNKVEVNISKNASPMSDVVSIVNDECNSCKILLGCSKKDGDDTRWDSFIKSFSQENNNEFIKYSVDIKTNISATTIRENINNIQREWFPDNLSDEDFNKIKNFL